MPTRKYRWFALLILLGGLLVGAGLVQAAPTRQDPVAGEQAFKTKCAACHTIGGGKLVGPDLKEVTTRRDDAWLHHAGLRL